MWRSTATTPTPPSPPPPPPPPPPTTTTTTAATAIDAATATTTTTTTTTITTSTSTHVDKSQGWLQSESLRSAPVPPPMAAPTGTDKPNVNKAPGKVINSTFSPKTPPCPKNAKP